MHCATTGKHKECVKLIVEAGADVNGINKVRNFSFYYFDYCSFISIFTTDNVAS